MITGTLNAWSETIPLAANSLQVRLVKAGVTVKANQPIKGSDVFRAMVGDREQAQARKALAEAEAQERENKIAEGELANLPAIEKAVWESLMLPLKQSIDSMPASLAAQCNPDNPSLAREVLTNWSEAVKRGIREVVNPETGRKEK